MNIKEYITSQYRKNPKLAGYDLSEGSNIHDLVIAPLAHFFESALGGEDVRLAKEMRGIDSLTELTLDELKNVAKSNMIEPSTKRASSTVVALYFTSPTEWYIPAGSQLSFESAIFKTREDVRISEKILAAGLDRASGLYVYSGIYVENDLGDNIPANVLGYMEGAPGELVKIEHPVVTNGVKDDDKESLISKIKNRKLSMIGGGVNGISALINAYYPGVDVKVVAPGDDMMRRDVVYNLVSGDAMPVMESSYRGKVRGVISNNKSMAYMTTHTEDELQGEFNPDNVYELSQGHYLSIAEAADSVATMSTGNILHEQFTQSSERIGSSVGLSDPVAAGDMSIEVGNGSLFEPGDMIHIVDRGGAIPIQSGVVESVGGEYGNTIFLYNKLSIAISDVSNVYVDIVNSEGIYRPRLDKERSWYAYRYIH